MKKSPIIFLIGFFKILIVNCVIRDPEIKFESIEWINKKNNESKSKVIDIEVKLPWGYGDSETEFLIGLNKILGTESFKKLIMDNGKISEFKNLNKEIQLIIDKVDYKIINVMNKLRFFYPKLIAARRCGKEIKKEGNIIFKKDYTEEKINTETESILIGKLLIWLGKKKINQMNGPGIIFGGTGKEISVFLKKLNNENLKIIKDLSQKRTVIIYLIGRKVEKEINLKSFGIWWIRKKEGDDQIEEAIQCDNIKKWKNYITNELKSDQGKKLDEDEKNLFMLSWGLNQEEPLKYLNLMGQNKPLYGDIMVNNAIIDSKLTEKSKILASKSDGMTILTIGGLLMDNFTIYDALEIVKKLKKIERRLLNLGIEKELARKIINGVIDEKYMEKIPSCLIKQGSFIYKLKNDRIKMIKVNNKEKKDDTRIHLHFDPFSRDHVKSFISLLDSLKIINIKELSISIGEPKEDKTGIYSEFIKILPLLIKENMTKPFMYLMIELSNQNIKNANQIKDSLQKILNDLKIEEKIEIEKSDELNYLNLNRKIIEELDYCQDFLLFVDYQVAPCKDNNLPLNSNAIISIIQKFKAEQKEMEENIIEKNLTNEEFINLISTPSIKLSLSKINLIGPIFMNNIKSLIKIPLKVQNLDNCEHIIFITHKNLSSFENSELYSNENVSVFLLINDISQIQDDRVKKYIPEGLKKNEIRNLIDDHKRATINLEDFSYIINGVVYDDIKDLNYKDLEDSKIIVQCETGTILKDEKKWKKKAFINLALVGYYRNSNNLHYTIEKEFKVFNNKLTYKIENSSAEYSIYLIANFSKREGIEAISLLYELNEIFPKEFNISILVYSSGESRERRFFRKKSIIEDLKFYGDSKVLNNYFLELSIPRRIIAIPEDFEKLNFSQCGNYLKLNFFSVGLSCIGEVRNDKDKIIENLDVLIKDQSGGLRSLEESLGGRIEKIGLPNAYYIDDIIPRKYFLDDKDRQFWISNLVSSSYDFWELSLKERDFLDYIKLSVSNFFLRKRENLIKNEKEIINIYTVINGRDYEKLGYMQIFYTIKNLNRSKYNIKYWFPGNLVSKNFINFIKFMSIKYGFYYEFLWFTWPRNLPKPKSKIKEIHGYKILFLDLIFPSDLEKILIIDADCIPIKNISKLWETKIKNIYAYPEFPHPTNEPKKNNWKIESINFGLEGSKNFYKSSVSIFMLKKYRKNMLGPIMRSYYQGLLIYAPELINNIAQDLPNILQKTISVQTLDKKWCWNSIWSSLDQRENAAIIDLSSNSVPDIAESSKKFFYASKNIPDWNENFNLVMNDYNNII